MLFIVEAEKSLFVNEWNALINNQCKCNITVELGHNELMAKTITIREQTEVPEIYKEGK